jgi:hypothetical protein
MKITHEKIRDEVEMLAMRVGQQAVTMKITEEAFNAGICDLLLPISDAVGNADEKAIYNNRQQLFRWLRSDSSKAVNRIAKLLPAIIKSLPAERQARLRGDDISCLAVIANRECADVFNAVILHSQDIEKEVTEAINALLALRPSKRHQANFEV